jgi:hypothetical protein
VNRRGVSQAAHSCALEQVCRSRPPKQNIAGARACAAEPGHCAVRRARGVVVWPHRCRTGLWLHVARRHRRSAICHDRVTTQHHCACTARRQRRMRFADAGMCRAAEPSPRCVGTTTASVHWSEPFAIEQTRGVTLPRTLAAATRRTTAGAAAALLAGRSGSPRDTVECLSVGSCKGLRIAAVNVATRSTQAVQSHFATAAHWQIRTMTVEAKSVGYVPDVNSLPKLA